jgi:hypothetical protein
MTLETASARIQWVSRWLDANIGKNSRGEVDDGIGLDALRLIKLMEESGEVVTNFIKFRNLNPRKAIANPRDTGTEEPIVKELFDVAFTAIGAAEHFLGNSGAALERFLEHAEGVKNRLQSAPEPHYFEHGWQSSCSATSPLWDGACNRTEPANEGDVPVHLDPKPWFVEEAVPTPDEPGSFDGRYSYDDWYATDIVENLAVWKPRQGYVQEREAYRDGR